MNADRLRQINVALLRDFAADPVAQCEQRHVHLVYAHLAAVVDAASLLPLSHPDFESRVDAWTWPTTTAYEACGVVRSNQPYRDFIRARFVWKERAGVTLTQLPSNTTAAGATAADGGTLLTISDGPRVGPAGRDPVTVRVTVPAAPAAVAGYPTIRRICLSTPGEHGNHAELADGVNTADVVYPQRERENVLHLVGEMPWFRFELPSGTPITDDPWAFRINYDVTPVSRNGQHLVETSTNTIVGPISRYSGHYGLNQHGDDTKRAILTSFAAELSPSRRMMLAAVLDVEGGPSAVATADGPKVSWGMNQWTWPPRATTGELHQILCYIFDFYPAAFDRCFGRYGIGVSFATRGRTWDKTPYTTPKIFRVSCCKLTLPGQTADIVPPIRPGLDAVGQHLQLADHHGELARAFTLLDRADTTSIAMLFLFFVAGHDADIQRAQAQWTSYRISLWLSTHRNPTNQEALDGFLLSLGSNVGPEDRLAHANNGIAAGHRAGQVYPALGARFNDVDTLEEWRDWAVRCDNAHKPTTPPRPANAGAPAPAAAPPGRAPAPVRPPPRVPAH